jgi:aspartate aminotransferase-like enzyme
MKLFTVGPVQMFDRTLKVASRQLPYFRTEEFSQVMLHTGATLKKLVGAEPDSKCVFITGSGSAAMESVVSNCFDEHDNVLVINGGTFGSRFKQLCNIYNIPNNSIDLSFGEQLDASHFETLPGNSYTALLVNIHETSSGQLYDIHLLSDFCKKHNMALVVDAISSFLADKYLMDEFGIDCTILSSQKGLALSPGMSAVILGNRFYKKNVEDKKMINLYLNLNEHIKDMERGQTPNTPAVGIILELQDMLKKIDEQGLDSLVQSTREKADYFRTKIKDLGLKTPGFPLSNALTPILFENNNAQNVYRQLKNNHQMILTPSGGMLADKLLRVGHFGNISLEDLDDLTAKLKEVL